MRLDKFNNPVFSSQDLFKFLYNGIEVNYGSITVDESNDIDIFEKVTGTLIPRHTIDENLTVDQFDHTLQDIWFIEEKYKNFDIRQYCLELCSSDNEITRVNEEMDEFERRNMMPLLRWLKYFVDTCLEENILWGVGRGSSVSSYVLFLLGVHQIDSLKYNLDWRDFLR